MTPETVRPVMSEEEADSLAGAMLDDSSYDRVVREDCSLAKPDGSPLLIFRRNAAPYDACRSAYPALRGAAAKSFNRGYASGRADEGGHDGDGREIAVASPTRWKPIKLDGTVSNTNYADWVESGIIGYFDRNARFPYCRTTAFNLDHPEKFAEAVPFIRAADAVFARELPERYAAQRAVAGRTSPDFTIRDTAFTTVTVNRNWQTAVHKDAGDLKEGFGVMSVLQGGSYRGGLFVLPRWRVAVDMRTRDVLLADVHEWHGNTPIAGEPGTYERISCVFYYRARMVHCGTAEQELEFAKNRKPGEPVLRAEPEQGGGRAESWKPSAPR